LKFADGHGLQDRAMKFSPTLGLPADADHFAASGEGAKGLVLKLIKIRFHYQRKFRTKSQAAFEKGNYTTHAL